MDRILKAFLTRQYEEGMALARESDVLDLYPVPEYELPPRRYLAHFRCKGLVLSPDHEVVEADSFKVGIGFPADYLRIPDAEGLSFRILFWISPPNVFNPHILDRGPLVCLGHIFGGMSLTDILYQLHAVITGNLVNTADGLNPEAAAWARQNLHRFPVDRRGIKRAALDFQIEPVGARTEPSAAGEGTAQR